MDLRSKIIAAIPWIEPILDYFDWRKRIIALAAGIGLAVWSFLRDLPWPVIVVLAAAAIVIVAYGLMFPAFVKLIHVGVNPRPNYEIWKHKREFALIQAAFLLADREPVWDAAQLSGDAAAWFDVLFEAIEKRDLAIVGTSAGQGVGMKIEREKLKKFCEAKTRYPEFLR